MPFIKPEEIQGLFIQDCIINQDPLEQKNCVDGRKQLVSFVKKYSVKHDICGKIVLTTTEKEKEKLTELKQRGESNGLINLEIIGPEKIKEIEPFLKWDHYMFQNLKL